ncbi:hypothetical protein [Kitasatospora sp. NPDC059673]|uniref:hypothetical protein n=1 Tax=Kitasatospora sp. NPDC059673 TaxID=3346901 RepID=UPI00368BD7D1
MGLFARLTRRRNAGGGAPGLTIDPAHGDPELTLLRERAAAGDWPGVRAVLDRALDQDDLALMISHLADHTGSESWLGPALEADPEDPVTLLAYGARHIHWGWEARTGARAQYVSEEQWRTFHERLEAGEELLFKAAELDPELLGPWLFLQMSGRGASIDRAAARYRFDAALRRSPGHPASHRQRLQQLCEKWSGSHEQMHSFARASMLAAPEGSPLGELVALAHIEHWLALPSGEDASYMDRDPVRAQLHEAADRSIRHPDHLRRRNWPQAHNTFALAFYLAGQPHAANLIFQEIGGAVCEDPWNYLGGDPVDTFRRIRAACA